MSQLSPLLIRFVCVFLGALSAGVIAQDSPATPPAIPEDTPAPQQKIITFGEMFASVDNAEANRRAGLRSSLLAQSMKVVPIVVIVESPDAYLETISGWEGPVKFPILYDDGSDQAREHIARFVRDFGPDEVVRIARHGKDSWGTTAQERQDSISKALAAAIHEPEDDWEVTLKALKATGVTSPGVVVLDPMDQHWAGGLALAAGRLEPIVFLAGPKNHYKELQPGQAQAINQAIEQGLRRLDLSFDKIGDEIDAITLAFRIGVKIKTGPKDRDRLATTDRIGRADVSLGGMRWAWCGQLYGTTASSVYQAMCSLFLPIESAFIWDGYPTDGQWSQYDGTQAGNDLEKAGFTIEVFDSPRASLAGFKGRAASGPVDASLILMNTKGSPYHFDLPQAHSGLGKPGDLPILAKPSVLHMVHSFSLSMPHQAKTVGGSWLDRGVYLYAGSVDEPFLTGFVPTPIVARRLLGQLPFAAAVHYDDGQAWKITVLGDPLKTLSPCGSRIGFIPEPINELVNKQQGERLGDRAKDWLKAGQYTRAIEDFVLTDQDQPVVRLAKALLKDKPEAVDDLGAKIIIQAAFRQGEHELVLDAYERLSLQARSDRLTRDVLWMAGRYRINRFKDPRAMALLRTNLREGQVVQDAEELALVLKRKSVSEAIGFLESIRSTMTTPSQVKALDKTIGRVR